MKVLLCQDVSKLGWVGDVVEVNDGYARNCLLPQRVAVFATESNVKAMAGVKAQRAAERQLVTEQLEQAARAVDGAEVKIVAKTNEQGHLFGSVTGRDVAEDLRSQGFEVADDIVKMPVHIKEVGTYEITLQFASDVIAKVSVVVVAEDKEVETSEQDS